MPITDNRTMDGTKGIEDSVWMRMQPDAYVLKSVWRTLKELKVDLP